MTRLRAAVAAAIVIAAMLAGCQLPSTCYGTEPDGETETLQPCPPGWHDGERRDIREDEFEHLELDD